MHTIPKPITQGIEELFKLCEQHPLYIPTEAAAAYLHMDGENLKACIDTGRCPFAIGWQKNIRGYRAYKIPTVTFFLWVTSGKMTGILYE